jgi:phosphoglycolate phosphatase
MVGDTAGDVNTGRINSMTAVGVAYGYGSREELAGADVVCDTTAELMGLLA